MEKPMEQLRIDFNRINVLLNSPIFDDLSNGDLDFMASFINQYKGFDFDTIIEKEPNKNSLDTLVKITKEIHELDFKEILAKMTKKLEKIKSDLERKCHEAKEKCHLWAPQDKSCLQYYQNKWKECNERYTEAIEKWNGLDANQVRDIMSICRSLSKTLKKYIPEIYDSTYIKYDTIKRIFNLVCTKNNMNKELFKFQKEDDLFSFLNLKYRGNYLDKISKGSKQRLCIFIDYISKNAVLDGKGVYWKERICEVLHINYDENRISSYKSTYKDFFSDLENCF
jgi:hypothetical protein